jgi:hypothetical protein
MSNANPEDKKDRLYLSPGRGFQSFVFHPQRP